MKRMLAVDDLARDERFERIRIEEVVFDPRSASPPAGQGAAFRPDDPDAPDAAPPAHARHLRGRDPGPRGRRAHLLRLRHRHRARRRAVRAQARHGPPVLGRGPPRRDLGEAHRAHGHRDRRVRRADAALRGGVQRRPGAAPHRRQPCPRGSRHRRVQHHARVRRRHAATRSSTSARTGCWPTRSPT